MTEYKLKLTRKQIDFVCKMLEIEDSQQAIDKLCSMMLKESVSPKEMPRVIDSAMERLAKK